MAVLSRKLGVAESTVRERYARLSSFISRWTLMVNPNLFHGRMGALWLEVGAQESKAKVVETLRLVEGVFIVINYSGRSLALVFFYEDGGSSRDKVRLMARIAASPRIIYTDLSFPSCDLPLSKTDLRLILNRQADMAKSNRRVAEDLGVSSRTVKRRLLRLVAAGAVWPLASLNVGAVRDCVYADLFVDYRDPPSRLKAEAEILPFVDDFLIFNGHFDSATEFNMMLPSVPAARALANRVAQVKGVTAAKLDFVEERLESYGILGDKVERLLAQRAAS